MPIYEYRCSKCGYEQENLIRGNEIPLCEDCGSQSLQRKISLFSTVTATPQYSGCDSGNCADMERGGLCACKHQQDPW